MILATSRQPENAWKFLDWWTTAEVQAKNAREYELTMGSAYRYTPANVEAMRSLSWTRTELSAILDVWEATRGIPRCRGAITLAGVWITPCATFSPTGNDPQEVLKEYVEDINREIQIKRPGIRIGVRRERRHGISVQMSEAAGGRSL